MILRGGSAGPNTTPTRWTVRAAGLPARVIVDGSHGNSGKDHVRQAGVAREVARIATGERGVVGLMLESFLTGGRQELGPATSWPRRWRHGRPTVTRTPR